LRSTEALEVEAKIDAAGLRRRQHGLAEIGLDLEFCGVDGSGQCKRHGECKCERGGSDRRHGNSSSFKNVGATYCSPTAEARSGGGQTASAQWLKKEIVPRCWAATRGDVSSYDGVVSSAYDHRRRRCAALRVGRR